MKLNTKNDKKTNMATLNSIYNKLNPLFVAIEEFNL